MAIYYEGTIGVGALGTYYVGARTQIGRAGGGRAEYRLLRPLVTNGSDWFVGHVRSRFPDEAPLTAADGYNSGIANGYQPHPIIVQKTSSGVTYALTPVEYAEPPFLAEDWALPTVASVQTTSATTLRLTFTSALPTPEDYTLSPNHYQASAYPITGALAVLGVTVLSPTALELTTSPQVPEQLYAIGVPQPRWHNNDPDLWLEYTTTTPIVFAGYGSIPTIYEPVDVSLSPTPDTRERRAAARAWLEAVYGVLARGQAGYDVLPLRAALLDAGVRAEVHSVSRTAPSSSEHRLTLGAVTFVGFEAAIARAEQVRRNVVRVHFVPGAVPPMENPGMISDALYDRGWQLAAHSDPTNHVPRVVWVAPATEAAVDLYLDSELAGPGITYRVSGAERVFLGTLSALFSTFGAAAARSTRRLGRSFDLASPEGTLVLDADGDYATDAGLESFRKRLIRRLTTMRGAYSHLPEYGLRMPVKGKLTAGALRDLQAQAYAQASSELGVRDVAVAVSSPAPGVVRLEVRAETRLGLVGVAVELPAA